MFLLYLVSIKYSYGHIKQNPFSMVLVDLVAMLRAGRSDELKNLQVM